MTQDRKELMATLERVRQSYNERDQNILVPLLEEQLTNTDADGINFRKIGKKFLVDSTELRMRRGFDDLATLIANPNDNIRCDELSPIVDEVEFEPCAFHLSLLPELNNLEYLNRLLTIPGQLGPTEVNLATRSPLATRITYGLVRRKIELIETLEAMRNDRDLDDPELLFVERVAQIVDELVRINKALSGSTFGGKMKHDQRIRQVSATCVEAYPRSNTGYREAS